MTERSAADRRARTVVALRTARRAVRSGAAVGLLLGVLVANEALGYRRSFPTISSRLQFAESFGSNAGLAAVSGPARRLDTIEGFVAWRMFSLMIVVGAIWGMLTATRLLRGEEEAGRWQLFLAGRTTRRGATGQALLGLVAGLAALWTVMAAFTVAAGSRPTVGFSTSDSLFYATAGSASAAVFLAVGALTSQLATTRRGANGLAAAVFGTSYVIRLVADGGAGLGWVRWASPLGWVENLAPLTGPRPLALVPIVVLVLAASATAVVLAGRRDVEESAFARHGATTSSPHLLGGPTALAFRLERWVALAWIGGLASLALVFGLVARAAAQGNIGDEAVGRASRQPGGVPSLGAAWIGYEFLYLAALLAFAAAGQVSAWRREEADGQLDNLLVRVVSRRSWLGGRVLLSGALVVSAGLAAGAGGWLGMSGGGDVGALAMSQAGLNVAVPGIVVLGVGTLLYSVAPRVATPLLYAFVLWSFLVEIIGTSLKDAGWLVDTSLLSQLGPVPATDVDWAAMAWLVGVATLAAIVGLAAFGRRDLAAG